MSARAKFVVAFADGTSKEMEARSVSALQSLLEGMGHLPDEFSIAEAEAPPAAPASPAGGKAGRMTAADYIGKLSEAALGMPLDDYKEWLAGQIFPSLRGKAPEEAIGSGRDVLRLAGEGLTYPLRGVGGALNLIAGNKRGGDYGIGETYEESRKGYGGIMGDVQEILHDPLNAVGGALGRGARASKTAFDLAKNAVLRRAAEGAAQESARPAVMGTETDPAAIAAAGLGNATFGMGLEAAGKLAGKAAARASKIGGKISDAAYVAKKYLTPRRLEEVASAKDIMQARAELKRFSNMEPERILAELEADYGVRLDDYASRPGRDFSLGDDIPVETLAESLADKNKASRNALLMATSPRNLQRIREAYRTQGRIADDIADALDFESLGAADQKIVGDALEAAGAGGKKISTKNVLDILLEPERAAAGRDFGPTGIETPMLRRIRRNYVDALLGADGAPREINPKDFNHYRKLLGDLDWDSMAAQGYTRSERAALQRAYGQSREDLLNFLRAEDPKAAEAYESLGSKLGLRDEVLRVLNAGNSKAAQRDKIATALFNRGDPGSNAPKTQSLFRALGQLDEAAKTDFAERAMLAKYANELSPHGEEFRLPDINPHSTGKGKTDDLINAHIKGETLKSAFVSTARAKAKELNKARAAAASKALKQAASGTGSFMRPAVYDRELTPGQQDMRDFIAETSGEDAAREYERSIHSGDTVSVRNRFRK